MATTAETNVKNYEVSPDTADHFNNLALFAKNMTLKDSHLYDDAENNITRWLDNILKKYYTIGLTEEECNDFANFVKRYNQELLNKLKNPRYKYD